MNKPYLFVWILVAVLCLTGCMKASPVGRGAVTSSRGRQVWWFKNTKPTWQFNYDAKTPIRTADWVDYLKLPFNPDETGVFSSLDPSVNAIDYGFFNPRLGGGHIAKAAQHALTYGNFLVGRQCLEEAVANYMTANNITTSPDRFFYDQGFWPMRKSGITSGDSKITKISKALRSLHGGDLVYSKIESDGAENGAEVVTLNCTTCHESRMLVPTCAAPDCAFSGTFKAVRSPWGTEGYISKNLKLMGQAVQDAVAIAASGSACASGPEKPIMAALYEIQKATHNSVNDSGQAQSIDMDPRRILAYTPDSSFYNPSGALAHTVLNLLVNEDSWANKKPTDIDQAYQMFRPEEVLNNNQFFPILNANFNTFYGKKYDGTPAVVNFSLNSAWGQKFYNSTRMFQGMGCSYTRPTDERSITIPCDATEKAIALAATTNSQAENPDLSTDTLSRFPGVAPNYKWPLRKYSGTEGVFERTRKLFIGLDSNASNPAIPDITNGRRMTYETINEGMELYNTRCGSCHGTASMTLEGGLATLKPGTAGGGFVNATRDMPARAWIANLRGQPYVQEDAPRDLVIKQYEGYRGVLSYGLLPDAKKLAIKNLVGVALEQRFGCYLSLTEFLQRATPKTIQVTSSVLDVQNLGYLKKAQLTHTPENQSWVLTNYPKHLIYWQNEHPECGPLAADGNAQPAEFYDAAFHGSLLNGVSMPKLSANETKKLIDYLVAISFDRTEVKNKFRTPITIRLFSPWRFEHGVFQFNLKQSLMPSGIIEGDSCSTTCAKFGESCNLAFERDAAAKGRTCCGDIDDSQGYFTRSTLSCFQSVDGTYRWGFCANDSECNVSIPNYGAPSTVYPIPCVNNRCQVQKDSPLHPDNYDPNSSVTTYLTTGANSTPTPTPPLYEPSRFGEGRYKKQ